MTKLRRYANWCTLAALGGLAVLSVVGAFLGAERASDMFNSPPLVVLWAGVAVLLLISVIFVKPVRKSPALVAAHLGPLLILIGGFLGSPLADGLWQELTGQSRFRSGYIVLSEGERTDRVIGKDFEKFVARLPFRVKLEDFEIEYYEPRDRRWALALVRPAGKHGESAQTTVEWREGSPVSLPGVDVRLRVLEYIANARPVYGEQRGPAVSVTDPDGNAFTLPIEQGQEISLDDRSVTVRVGDVIRRTGADEHNPSVALEIERPAGAYSIYLTPRFVSRARDVDELELRYILARPTDAVTDTSSDTPAMKVSLRHADREITQWLIPRRGAEFVGTDLGRLLESEGGGNTQQAGPELYLVKPGRTVKDYRSHLAVIEDGQVVRRKAVEVNYPLHYGGYHIYQSSYGGEDQPYVGLMVVSDTGLYFVYAGLALLVGSVFWWSWGRPAAAFWRGRSHAD